MSVGRAVGALVEAVGVDHGESDREFAGALMMVDDDHVEFGRAGLVERFERLCATIDGDREGCAPIL